MPRVVAYWLLFGVTMALYVVMVGVTLPTIAADAGGATAFDLRLGGYSLPEARQFLTNLTSDGLRLYTDVQLRLDSAFPGLLAILTGWSLAWLLPKAWGPWRWLALVAASPMAVFDYLENDGIRHMLAAGPGLLTAEMVESASTWTIAKGVVSAAVLSVLLLLALFRLVRWVRARRRLAAPA